MNTINDARQGELFPKGEQPPHIMLDLETFGSGSTAVIVSIGAVKFYPGHDDLLDSFYTAVSPSSCTRVGLKMDASTMLWWMAPERADARNQLLNGEAVELPEALDGFAQWLGAKRGPVWGNGAAFDNVILRNAYFAIGEEAPWPFWNDRCFRTLKALAPKNLEPRRQGTHHNALDDAIHQAKWLQAISMHLGL